MTAEAIARRAALLADRTRAAMCLALLDGRAWTAGELARHAGVAASTASEHLATLAAAGAVAPLRQGRHTYVRLADPRLADLLEELSDQPPPPVGLRQVRAAARLAAARTCYDHIAGDLGVAVHDALVASRLVTDSGLTDAGREWFVTLLGPDALVARRRPLVRHCLDWTRRVPHLGGALGALLSRHMLDSGWLVAAKGDRAVAVTPAGCVALVDLLGPGVCTAAEAALATRDRSAPPGAFSG
jgi:DNA-binding transcriptional ArsR family regulator